MTSNKQKNKNNKNKMYTLGCEFSDLVHSYIEKIGRKFLIRIEYENSHNEYYF